MRFIDLGNGLRTAVDDHVYEAVKDIPWYAAKNGRSNHVYVRSSQVDPLTGRRLLLHHAVARMCNVPGVGETVDHIDGDTLNNQAANLRWATRWANSAARRRSDGPHRTPYLGVTLDRHGRAVARITHRRRRCTLGTFLDMREAAICRDRVARLLRGEYAVLNFDADDGCPLVSRVDPERSCGPRRDPLVDLEAVVRGGMPYPRSA